MHKFQSFQVNRYYQEDWQQSEQQAAITESDYIQLVDRLKFTLESIKKVCCEPYLRRSLAGESEIEGVRQRLSFTSINNRESLRNTANVNSGSESVMLSKRHATVRTYSTWERPLNELEYTILLYLMKLVAYLSDFIVAKWKK